MNKRRLLRLGIAGLIAVGALAFLFFQLRPVPVQVAKVETDVPIQVYGLGTVQARVASEVGFEVGNTLIELRADHGDLVATGQVLARLHLTEQEAQVAKAVAAVARAEADLERAQARVEKAEAVLDQKRQVNRRKQELVQQNVVSIETAEEAQTEVSVAAAELAVAHSELAVAGAALADARAQLHFEEVMLAHHTLEAPYDALVVERHKELGTVLAPGEPVFSLIDPATVWVLAYVDEARAGGIGVGQPAEIRLRSLPGQVFPGEVVRIGIESDPLGEERRVYIAFDEVPADVHLNEQAEALITTDRLDHALLVPATAVDAYDGASGSVWILEEGRVARREISIGAQTLEGRLEIASELPPGASVVTGPVSGLEEGQRASASVEASS